MDIRLTFMDMVTIVGKIVFAIFIVFFSMYGLRAFSAYNTICDVKNDYTGTTETTNLEQTFSVFEVESTMYGIGRVYQIPKQYRIDCNLDIKFDRKIRDIEYSTNDPEEQVWGNLTWTS